MSEFRIIIELWPMFLSFIGFIVWLVRLEAKAANLKGWLAAVQNQVNDIRAHHEDRTAETLRVLTEIREKLARIEGQLSVTGGHA